MKIGLVLEGGANRGVFTSGVLDYFMEHTFTRSIELLWITSSWMMLSLWHSFCLPRFAPHR